MKQFEELIQDFNVMMNDIAELPESDYRVLATAIIDMLSMHSPKQKPVKLLLVDCQKGSFENEGV
jgi:hypothetical protein